MLKESIQNLRRAIDEKHCEALHRLDELESYLLGIGDNGVLPSSAEPKMAKSDTHRSKVNAACTDWCDVAGICRKTELTEGQIRGVLYDPHYRDSYKRRKQSGRKIQFRLKTDVDA